MRRAEEYLEKAIKLLADEDYPDAAEKIWGSVLSSTQALARRYLKRKTPHKDQPWRDFVREAFIRAGLEREEAERKADYFIDVRSKLHGECFYGLFYEEAEHRPLIDMAREYLDDIRRLLL